MVHFRSKFKRQLEDGSLILSEVNVKEIEYLEDTTGVLVKKRLPDFKKKAEIWKRDELVAGSIIK